MIAGVLSLLTSCQGVSGNSTVAPGTLSISPSSIAFGNTNVGAQQTSTVTLANSGGSDLSITQAVLSGAGFSMSNLALPLTIHAGSSAPATITFAPTGGGNFSGSITFSVTSNQTNSQVVLPFTGTGDATGPGVLAANPTTLAFPNVQVGNNTSLSETLTNTGGATVTLSQANVTGAVFSVSGLSLPLDLTANQSVTFTVTFTPTAAQTASGSLSVVSTASNSPLSIALSGTGTAAGQLAVSPTILSFGDVAVGSNSQLSGTLTASGTSVTVTSASFNNSEFALSGISLPATITVGQPATFTVTFTPSSSGLASASLSFASNASNSPAVQSMTGTGTTVQHYVNLTWDASTDAVGYNIYRGSVSGGPYTMINTSLETTTAYTDNSVSDGQTYYYVTTSVDSNENESGYSNVAQAIIPSS
jgi:ribosomal protein L11